MTEFDPNRYIRTTVEDAPLKSIANIWNSNLQERIIADDIYYKFHHLLMMYGHSRLQRTSHRYQTPQIYSIERTIPSLLAISSEPGAVAKIELSSERVLAYKIHGETTWNRVNVEETINLSLNDNAFLSLVPENSSVENSSSIDRTLVEDSDEIFHFMKRLYAEPRKTIYIPDGEINIELYLWPDQAYNGISAGMYGDMIKRMHDL